MSPLEAFGKLDDPRIDRNKRHLLIDILVVAICGTVCGADRAENQDTHHFLCDHHST
ncbi:MAG: transposase family protein [Gammaproteobacteria bacterium]